MSKDKEIKEISSMAGGSGAGPAATTKKRKKMPKDYYLSRTQFIEEVRLRKTIQEVVKRDSLYDLLRRHQP